MLTAAALLFLGVAAAAFVQGAVGIGFALIVAPALALLTPALLPGSLLILMLPLNAFVALRGRSALDLPSVMWVTAGRFAGTFPGLWVLVAFSREQLDRFVGVTTILAAAATMVAPAFAPSRSAFGVTGLVTGVVETATGIGGPPLALVYQHHAAESLRASIAACFAIGQVISLVFLAFAGRLALPQLTGAALLWPAVALGVVAGRAMHGRLDRRLMRGALLAFAFVSGVLLLVER